MNREKVLSVAMMPALPLLSPNLLAPCQAQRNHSSICLKLPRFQQRLNLNVAVDQNLSIAGGRA